MPNFAPSATLDKALTWERFKCGLIGQLPSDFFSSKPFMHESGQSYVRLAHQAGLNISGPIHFLEMGHANFSPTDSIILSTVTLDSLVALYRDAVLIEDPQYLMLRVGGPADAPPTQVYKVYRSSTWNVFKASEGRSTLRQEDGLDTRCDQQYLEYCWNFIKSKPKKTNEIVYKLSLAATFVMLIVATVIQMLERHRKARRDAADQRLLARVTAHELRTPVANLKLIEHNLKMAKTPIDYSGITSDLSDQIRRLSLLTDASQLLLDTGKNNHSKLTFIEPLSEIRQSMRTLALQRAINITDRIAIDDPDQATNPVKVKCQLGMLKICVENIIDNALKYGATPVMLKMSSEPRRITISISDSGFFDSNRKNTGGLGIGLDLVQSAMKRMGGKLKVKKDPTEIQLILELHQ